MDKTSTERSQSIICPLSRAAKKFPKEAALIFGTRSISYQQLDQCVNSTAKQLKKIGLRQGQRVTIVDQNRIEYIVVLWALWRIGVTSVLINPRFPEEAVRNISQAVLAQVLFTSIHSFTGSPKIIARKFRLDDVINFDIRETQPAAPIIFFENQPLTIMATSGTTQKPKLAVHSFGNHYFSADGANTNMPLRPGDRWLLSLPLYHVGGLAILWRAVLGGAGVVVPREEETIDSLLVRNKITDVSLVAAQLQRLIEKGLEAKSVPQLKRILLGGGPVSQGLIEKAKEKNLPLYISYGLTEMSSQVVTSAQILPHRELKISNEGEILVRGKTLFLGYLDGPNINRPLTPDGWFATGDLGNLDEKGNLTVHGRKDNMFVSGGENIQPEEIEYYLNQQAEIAQSMVVDKKDEEFGARPVGFLKFNGLGALNLKTLNARLEKYLPRFKLPMAYYAWPQELEAKGLKISRQEIRNLLNASSSDMKPLL